MITLAIDAMSGDTGPEACVPGAIAALQADANLRVLLVGQPPVLERLLARDRRAAQLRGRWELVAAAEVVAMDDKPREAIRRRKHSSMRIAIDLVKDGRAAGAVSAGNTGALTAIAHFVLKCLPNIERAPIISAIPAAHGLTYMLDLGANTHATAEQLRQFAVMGAIVARDVHGIERPRVGLLNIGTEEIKGHEVVQLAHALLRSSNADLNYVGFVEGHDIFRGTVDVVVTDGFTGNVALKSMEGVAQLIANLMRREFDAGPASRLAGLVARPVLRRVASRLDPRRYNGAVMVGLTGVVVKSHGSADALAFARAIGVAKLAVARGLIQHVAQAGASVG
ncbi:MAG: phosphate acyltransferase PlsX [Steroidobacteraceae bacterium]|nr:phosphate acyltransferase PlsX [Steroidobacteraceae bacterium]MDW8259476.1 phosphate acyltransferase PlsX [Gammaproteobacteria bacterium]